MKIETKRQENGSILVIALLTITILTMICAVSLHVTTQTTNATTQTTSWQQSMSGAEAAVDQAMKALNTKTWTGWYPVSSSSLPSGQPSPTTTPFPSGYSTNPAANQYYYYSSSFALQGEASNSVQTWVTVDNGSVSPVSSNLTGSKGQAYRIRAGAAVNAPGPARVVNNKLDNDLRKISLRWNRFASSGSGAVGTPQAVRRIELVAIKITDGRWDNAVTLQGKLTMSGGSFIDSFKSGDPFQSTNNLYDATKVHQSPNYYGTHASVGLLNSTGSNLGGLYLYGTLAYNGPAPQNTGHVGTLTPTFTATVPSASPPPSDTGLTPSWSAPSQTYGGGLPFTTTTSLNSAYVTVAEYPVGSGTYVGQIKVAGDFNVSGSNSVSFLPATIGGHNVTQWVVWVTGKLVTSGSAVISQASNVKTTWYVGSDITISGQSYQNQSGLASAVNIVGYGPSGSKIDDSGSGNLIASLYAPNYDATISGQASFTGALIANTLTLSGSGGFHYDESLSSAGSTSNYSYASWFEDNSDPARGITY